MRNITEQEVLERIKNDQNFCLKNLPYQWRDNKNICVEAYKQNYLNYNYISDRLKRDREFIKQLILLNYLHKSCRSLGVKLYNCTRLS